MASQALAVQIAGFLALAETLALAGLENFAGFQTLAGVENFAAAAPDKRELTGSGMWMLQTVVEQQVVEQQVVEQQVAV